MRWLILTLAILAWSPINFAHAQSNKRVALVIGNDLNNSLLGNPARDAKIVGEALGKIGFTLVGAPPLTDLSKERMEEAIEVFGKMAKDADVALFYFSGHGIQVDNRNYLVPVGFESGQSPIVRALSAGVLMAELAKSGARVKIVLLDACRTPFVKGDSGLASMQDYATNGTVIGFATQPNRTAWPGPKNGNSPYAKALARVLSVQGLQLYDLLIEAGLEVMKVTNNAQEPSVTITPVKVVLNQGTVTDPASKPITPPTITGDLPNGQALRYIQNAHKLLDVKDYAGARNQLDRGIQVDPKVGLTYNYRGYSWYEEGLTKRPIEAIDLYSRALSDLNQAIQLSPDYAPAYRHRGKARVASNIARQKLGRPTANILDAAIKDLNKAVELDPKSKTNSNALGEAYLLNREYNSSMKYFTDAIARDESYAAPYAGLCATYVALGKLELAKDYAKRAADRSDEFKSKSCLTGRI